MELKPGRLFSRQWLGQLLIVPYGIETGYSYRDIIQGRLLIVPYGIETDARDKFVQARKLLIVPYGIETKAFLRKHLPFLLLIVPYGIETAKKWSDKQNRAELLIVPYGIETGNDWDNWLETMAFNRTLWNWNKYFKITDCCQSIF